MKRHNDIKVYGYELILDLHECNSEAFNRASLDRYFTKLCKSIDMVKCERYWWDDMDVPPKLKQTEPHTKGTSAVQFILTSSIVIHTLDELKAVYVNIFSCKKFDQDMARDITVSWFEAEQFTVRFIERI